MRSGHHTGATAKPFLTAVPRPDGGAYVLDPPSGTAVGLSPTDVDLLVAGDVVQWGEQRRRDESGTGDQNEGWPRNQSDEATLFHEACAAARTKEACEATLRLGFVVDRLTDDQAADAVLDARDRLQASRAERVFLHFWIGADDAWDRTTEIAQSLAAIGDTRFTGVSVTLDPSHSITPRAETATLSLAALAPGARQAVFRLSPEALERAGDADTLAGMTFSWQGVVFRQRFSPSFVLTVTPATVDTIGGALFEALCFSGVYPRNVLFVFADDDTDHGGLCEVYDTSWTTHEAVAATLLARPTHRLIEPLALGLADVVRGYLLCDKRWMRTSGCPFPRQGVVYAGEYAGRCPVAAAKAASMPSSAATVLPSFMAAPRARLSIENGDHDPWSARGPHSVGLCRSCRVAPLCGSGCAVRAYEGHGDPMAPDCPPVDRVLAAEGVICSAADI